MDSTITAARSKIHIQEPHLRYPSAILEGYAAPLAEVGKTVNFAKLDAKVEGLLVLPR